MKKRAVGGGAAEIDEAWGMRCMDAQPRATISAPPQSAPQPTTTDKQTRAAGCDEIVCVMPLTFSNLSMVRLSIPPHL